MSVSFGRVTRRPFRRSGQRYTRLFFEHVNITIWVDRDDVMYRFDDPERAWDFAKEQGVQVDPANPRVVVLEESLK